MVELLWRVPLEYRSIVEVMQTGSIVKSVLEYMNRSIVESMLKGICIVKSFLDNRSIVKSVLCYIIIVEGILTSKRIMKSVLEYNEYCVARVC